MRALATSRGHADAYTHATPPPQRAYAPKWNNDRVPPHAPPAARASPPHAMQSGKGEDSGPHQRVTVEPLCVIIPNQQRVGEWGEGGRRRRGTGVLGPAPPAVDTVRCPLAVEQGTTGETRRLGALLLPPTGSCVG